MKCALHTGNSTSVVVVAAVVVVASLLSFAAAADSAAGDETTTAFYGPRARLLACTTHTQAGEQVQRDAAAAALARLACAARPHPDYCASGSVRAVHLPHWSRLRKLLGALLGSAPASRPVARAGAARKRRGRHTLAACKSIGQIEHLADNNK